jgi:oligopeptide transport system substrate-binding protein
LQRNLNVEVNITTQEFQIFIERFYSADYSGIAECSEWGLYLDPNWFLGMFVTGSSVNATGWSDPKYDDMLAKANSKLDQPARMSALAECEKLLLRAMPFMPVFHHARAYPQKPYVLGMPPNVMDVHSLKYAWIDTNWRPL